MLLCLSGHTDMAIATVFECMDTLIWLLLLCLSGHTDVAIATV